MNEVFIVSDNIISPLGESSAQNFAQLERSVSGVKRHNHPAFLPEPFFASLFADARFRNDEPYTLFEQLLISSIEGALQGTGISTSDKKTILIISSTKGNIGLLETAAYNQELERRISLNTSANLVARHFNFVHKPLVVCHACVSGLLALITAQRLIRSGMYETAVVAAADLVTRFVLTGFQSFQALSPGVCKPFDSKRDGLNLGEAAATMVVSSAKKYTGKIKLLSGSVNNDANHISGPSRSGEELSEAINRSLSEAGVSAEDIDFISAHGTATLYNDEMEAKAITLSGLQQVPVNSLKAYFGHTLGAAGLLESVITVHCMQRNTVLPSLGYSEPGVTKPIHICKELLHAPLEKCLKTASGFGGCNAAVVFAKS